MIFLSVNVLLMDLLWRSVLKHVISIVHGRCCHWNIYVQHIWQLFMYALDTHTHTHTHMHAYKLVCLLRKFHLSNVRRQPDAVRLKNYWWKFTLPSRVKCIRPRSSVSLFRTAFAASGSYFFFSFRLSLITLSTISTKAVLEMSAVVVRSTAPWRASSMIWHTAGWRAAFWGWRANHKQISYVCLMPILVVASFSLYLCLNVTLVALEGLGEFLQTLTQWFVSLVWPKKIDKKPALTRVWSMALWLWCKLLLGLKQMK